MQLNDSHNLSDFHFLMKAINKSPTRRRFCQCNVYLVHFTFVYMTGSLIPSLELPVVHHRLG